MTYLKHKNGSLEEKVLEAMNEEMSTLKVKDPVAALKVFNSAKGLGLKASLVGKFVRVSGNKRKINDFGRTVIGKSSMGSPKELSATEIDKIPREDKFLTQRLKEQKMDPVNKKALKKDFDDRKDKDVDNDGDVDASDKYLVKRRKAITKAIAKEGNKFTMALKQARDNGEDEMVVSGKTYKVKEVEETMKENMKSENSYFKVSSMRDALQKVWSESVEEEKEEIKEFVKSDGSKRRVKEGDNRLKANKSKVEDISQSPNPANSQHLCAKNVVHEKWGKGNTIFSMHADPDEKGLIEWYDVWFQHGIEKKVPTSDLEIVTESHHENHGKKKDKMIKSGKKMKKEKTDTGKEVNSVEVNKEEGKK